MIDFLIYGFDNRFIFWPMVLLATFGFIFIMRTFGIRSALIALGAFAAALFHVLSIRKARQSGWEDRKDKEKRDVKNFQNDITRTRNEFELDADRLRDDDGFKRKQ